ncbi:hypothetical protein FH972_000568 [Carpinus fangiana]|uniref:Uncharacterized protein n=1 Tax=Carpinus fangiana TaxID=176857 RepID=A0A5N6QBH2_9ROSI|nr:hypothetical protein FH972_000568 [Carpinus fangiana]
MPMANAYQTVSSLSRTAQPQVEWLMLPSDEKVDGTHSRCSVASSTSEKMLHKIKNVFEGLLDA